MANVIQMERGRLLDGQQAQLRSLLQTFHDRGGHHLVVHLHGGLVSRAELMRTAQKIQPRYEAAGAFPLFLAWSSDELATLASILTTHAGHPAVRAAYRILMRIVPPVTPAPAGIKAHFMGLPAPAATSDATLEALGSEFRDALLADPEMQAALRAEGLTVQFNKLAPASAATAMGSIATTLALDAFSVPLRIVERFRAGRDHGLAVTILEEIYRSLPVDNIGRALWNEMKANIDRAFGPDPRLFGGTALLGALAEMGQSGRVPVVSLVAHSAGAIFAGRLLQEAQRRGLQTRFNLILLAPACTMRFFHETMGMAWERVGQTRLFAMNDPIEQADDMAGPAYPASLLYFVSGLLENTVDEPLLGMQRFFLAPAHQPDPSVRFAREHFQGNRAPVWSPTTSTEDPGRQSTARRHGAFDDEDEATLQSVAHLLRAWTPVTEGNVG